VKTPFGAIVKFSFFVPLLKKTWQDPKNRRGVTTSTYATYVHNNLPDLRCRHMSVIKRWNTRTLVELTVLQTGD